MKIVKCENCGKTWGPKAQRYSEERECIEIIGRCVACTAGPYKVFMTDERAETCRCCDGTGEVPGGMVPMYWGSCSSYDRQFDDVHGMVFSAFCPKCGALVYDDYTIAEDCCIVWDDEQRS